MEKPTQRSTSHKPISPLRGESKSEGDKTADIGARRETLQPVGDRRILLYFLSFACVSPWQASRLIWWQACTFVFLVHLPFNWRAPWCLPRTGFPLEFTPAQAGAGMTGWVVGKSLSPSPCSSPIEGEEGIADIGARRETLTVFLR
jgi:hypothetical protein